MEPAFQRGDLLFLASGYGGGQITAGEIVVFRLEGREIPIVHRVLKVRQVQDEGETLANCDYYFFTPGP
jgi:signal peptidase